MVKLPFGFQLNKKSDGTYLSRPKRAPSRGRPLGQRFFNGAANNDMTFSWATSDLTLDEKLGRGLIALRTRSRDLAINNDHGRKFIRLLKSQVVGPVGMTMQARATGFDGKPDKLANDANELAFKEWCKDQNCSMSGTIDWVEWQELFITTIAQDGEIFIRKVKGSGAGPKKFALTIIDPNLIDPSLNEDLGGGRKIRLGIELNGWGRPLAYYCRAEESVIDGFTSKQGRNFERVPASQVIHQFIKEGPNQTRGIPWMCAAMLRMQMLGGFEEAALVNARVGAAKVGVITTQTGEDFTGDDVDLSTGDQIMSADPGGVVNLAQGQSIQAWDPAYPNGEFEVFTKSILRSISAGLGVDYAALTGDLSDTNYSSMRYGLIESRDFFKTLHGWMIRKFCTPVFEEWLAIALGTGAITVMGHPLPLSKFEKFKVITWQPRGFAWVDPLKDLTANKLAIDECIASRSEVIRDRGRDPEDVWQEIARDNERLAELGIQVGEPAAKDPEEFNDDKDKKED